MNPSHKLRIMPARRHPESPQHTLHRVATGQRYRLWTHPLSRMTTIRGIDGDRHAMTPAISVSHLNKTYASGFQALKDINLDIRHGEIFALLGPNGAGKTTLINVICGIVKPSTGTVTVDGHDILTDYRASRSHDRPGAAGTDHRRLRDAAGDHALFPRAVRQAAESRPSSRRCSRTCRCGTRKTPGS